MTPGYLCVETHPQHPNQVRVYSASERPTAAAHPEAVLRYIASFADTEAGLMHFHARLRRRLLDVDNRVYRVDIATAIAAIEAEGLRHERVWVDPTLAATVLEAVEQGANALRRRAHRRDLAWRVIGAAAIALLLLNLLGVI